MEPVLCCWPHFPILHLCSLRPALFVYFTCFSSVRLEFMISLRVMKSNIRRTTCSSKLVLWGNGITGVGRVWFGRQYSFISTLQYCLNQPFCFYACLSILCMSMSMFMALAWSQTDSEIKLRKE